MGVDHRMKILVKSHFLIFKIIENDKGYNSVLIQFKYHME